MVAKISNHPGTLPIRDFDVSTDLLSVSDLVELCFADRLSPDGEALLRKMRSSAHNKRFQEWAFRMAGRVSMPFTGYVWEEAEEIIGNLSLIPYHVGSKHYYMIANVAVHPELSAQRNRSFVGKQSPGFFTAKKAGWHLAPGRRGKPGSG